MKNTILFLLFISVTAFSLRAQNNTVTQEKTYFIVDKMPEYPGGDEALRSYLAEHLKYPESAKANGIEGRVYVSFVVNTDGTVSDAKIARGVDPALNQEALRVVNSLAKWTPGMKDGHKVKVAYTLPLNFEVKPDNSDKKNKVASEKRMGDVYFIVDKMPEYPGGDKALRSYLAEHLKYPESAKANGIEGRVYVIFVVNTDGTVSDAKIARGVDPALDAEALRVVNSLPQWMPGTENEKPVKVSYTVPINFEIEGLQKNKS